MSIVVSLFWDFVLGYRVKAACVLMVTAPSVASGIRCGNSCFVIATFIGEIDLVVRVVCHDIRRHFLILSCHRCCYNYCRHLLSPPLHYLFQQFFPWYCLLGCWNGCLSHSFFVDQYVTGQHSTMFGLRMSMISINCTSILCKSSIHLCSKSPTKHHKFVIVMQQSHFRNYPVHLPCHVYFMSGQTKIWSISSQESPAGVQQSVRQLH